MQRIHPAVLLASACLGWPAAAQDADLRAGLNTAREVCGACHAVLAGETQSPHRQAPSFERIARTPGMTSTALTVALRTSHQTMPNLMFEDAELRDVIAYILSLDHGR
jgi:mono/diheme cytochrome c family protein